MRYKSYCANLGRSFIVDPSKVSKNDSGRRALDVEKDCLSLTQDQEAIYALLVSLQSEMLSQLKEGAAAKDLYQHALSYVKGKRPELEAHLVKNIGHGVCSPSRDKNCRLTSYRRWVWSSVTDHTSSPRRVSGSFGPGWSSTWSLASSGCKKVVRSMCSPRVEQLVHLSG